MNFMVSKFEKIIDLELIQNKFKKLKSFNKQNTFPTFLSS